VESRPCVPLHATETRARCVRHTRFRGPRQPAAPRPHLEQPVHQCAVHAGVLHGGRDQLRRVHARAVVDDVHQVVGRARRHDPVWPPRSNATRQREPVSTGRDARPAPPAGAGVPGEPISATTSARKRHSRILMNSRRRCSRSAASLSGANSSSDRQLATVDSSRYLHAATAPQPAWAVRSPRGRWAKRRPGGGDGERARTTACREATAGPRWTRRP